jgi:hypothetical protein
MDFILGSITTIVALLSYTYFKNKMNKQEEPLFTIPYSQSFIYEKMKSSTAKKAPEPAESQSSKHRESQMIRIAVVEDYAYWIRENVFYCASVDEIGRVDFSTAIPVDTMTMNKVELDKMIFIIDKLTEGNRNDSSNSGY